MKDWQTTLVALGSSLEKAIATMDKSALRIALIVDEKRQLLGTLTDGDVRRALLEHVSMDVPVSEVRAPEVDTLSFWEKTTQANPRPVCRSSCWAGFSMVLLKEACRAL